jgi:hypothetical protein
MKVKTRNRIIEANKEPIMLILDQQDRENIAAMSGDAVIYLGYPAGIDKGQMQAWVDKTITEIKTETKIMDTPHRAEELTLISFVLNLFESGWFFQ